MVICFIFGIHREWRHCLVHSKNKPYIHTNKKIKLFGRKPKEMGWKTKLHIFFLETSRPRMIIFSFSCIWINKSVFLCFFVYVSHWWMLLTSEVVQKRSHPSRLAVRLDKEERSFHFFLKCLQLLSLLCPSHLL